jgi:hypothetical protein
MAEDSLAPGAGVPSALPSRGVQPCSAASAENRAILDRITCVQPLETREGSDVVLVGYDGSYFVARGPVGRALTSFMAARSDWNAARQHYCASMTSHEGAPSFEEAMGTFIAQVRVPRPRPRADRGLWVVRRIVVPAALARKVASWSCWLFRPVWCLAAMLLASAGFVALFAAGPGLAASRTLGRPGLIVVVVLSLVLWHEIGHCAGAHHAGAPSGGIGVGVYFVFPVLFADVRHSWIASRRGRLLVDVGGIYFQFVATGLLAWWSAWTSSAVGTEAVVSSSFLMLHTLNPCLKMDGYWILSDLLGCYNLRERALQPARRGESLPGWIRVAYRVAVVGFFASLVATSLSVLPANWLRLSSLLHGFSVSGGGDVRGAAASVLAAVVLTFPAIVVVASLGSLVRLARAWFSAPRPTEA